MDDRQGPLRACLRVEDRLCSENLGNFLSDGQIPTENRFISWSVETRGKGDESSSI